MGSSIARAGLILAAAVGVLATPLAAEPPEPTYGTSIPEEARAKLNREQAESAQRQLEENAASKRAYEEAEYEREEQMRRDLEAYEQEKKRLAKEHAAAMDVWRADVAACRSGDRTRCASSR
ncbi:hypothetical protein [Novosphingobium sp. M1R2S20]|uniref:Uncharacterized protein n=1 Tax=Novosphingobium rhizovicinum TaxID=3228928 RepID=A0ABV3R8N4_9SPHN